MLYLLAFILVLFGLWIPETFLTQTTFKLVLADQVVIGILGLALLIPLTAGAFDLSVGAMLAFSLVIVSWFEADTGLNGVLSAVIALAACAAVGFLSGMLIVQVPRQLVHRHARHEPGARRRDAVHLGQQADHRRLLRHFLDFGRRELLGIPIVVYYLVALALVLWYVLECTPLGRHLFATGANPEAARLSGVRTDRLVWGSLVASAVVAGIAGIVYGAKIGSFSNTFGPPLLFPAFAAVFFGSTQFKSGPNVWGTIARRLHARLRRQGPAARLQQGVYWITPLFNGVALIVAVALASRSAVPRPRPKAVADADAEAGRGTGTAGRPDADARPPPDRLIGSPGGTHETSTVHRRRGQLAVTVVSCGGRRRRRRTPRSGRRVGDDGHRRRRRPPAPPATPPRPPRWRRDRGGSDGRDRGRRRR